LRLVKGTQTQSDGRAKPVGTLYDDTFGNRLPTGEGEFGWPVFVGALDSLGFECFWGLEVMSTELRSVPVEVATRGCSTRRSNGSTLDLSMPRDSASGPLNSGTSAAAPRCGQIR
jgi:hypothetical protein